MASPLPEGNTGSLRWFSGLSHDPRQIPYGDRRPQRIATHHVCGYNGWSGVQPGNPNFYHPEVWFAVAPVRQSKPPGHHRAGLYTGGLWRFFYLEIRIGAVAPSLTGKKP